MCRANSAQATLFGLDKDILTNTSFPAYEALIYMDVPIARRDFQKCNSCHTGRHATLNPSHLHGPPQMSLGDSKNGKTHATNVRNYGIANGKTAH